MSQHSVRTTRSSGFRNSSVKVAGLAGMAGLTLGLSGCELPPEGPEGVEAISSALMAVVENGTAADSPAGPVQMQFTIARPFDPPEQAMNILVSTMVYGYNGAPAATPGSSCGAGIDYIAAENQPLTIPAGAVQVTASVTVCPDSLVEGTETFLFHVVDAADGQCSGERCLAVGRITDPAAPVLPSLRINNITVSEPVKGSRVGTFTLTLSATSNDDVTVRAATANDSATGSSSCLNFWFPRPDFVFVNRDVVIPAGQLTATVSVPICGDGTIESMERFFMNLSNPVNATIADSRGIATVLD